MSPESQDLVRQSFAKVVSIALAAADMFYGRLFTLDPSLRRLFKGAMAEQGRKLMAMIGVAVGNLDRLETVVPAVQDLGRRHVRYGVRAELQEGLGEAFTPAVEAVWGELYQALATVMTEAAA